MAESIIYQLNCNQRHDKCFYIKLKKSKAHIIILGYNNRRYYLLRSLLASFHPISSGWVGENIFLLSESSLYILTIPSFTLVQVPLPAYKIIDILFFSFEKGYIFIILERRQIFIGDLSPDNIILSSNGEISLIDVEYYRFHQQEIPHALGTSGFWCSKYSDNHATIYAFFALWYYLSFPSEYQKLLLKQEPMYDCNIERYQSICEDMPAIIEIKDYKTILKILRDYIIGGK